MKAVWSRERTCCQSAVSLFPSLSAVLFIEERMVEEDLRETLALPTLVPINLHKLRRPKWLYRLPSGDLKLNSLQLQGASA